MASASTFSLMLRLGFGMLLIMGVMLVASGMLKKRGLVAPAKGAAAARIDIVARRGLGRHASLAVVRTNGRDLLIGITDQHVTLLRESATPLGEQISIDLDEEEAAAALLVATDLDEEPEGQRTALPNGGQFATPSQAWKAMLENLRERSVRR